MALLHSGRLAFLLAALPLAAVSAAAQSASPALVACEAQRPATTTAGTVSYAVAFPNAQHHEAEISLAVAGLPADRPLELRMSRSSPGRYALHEFAKNVYAVQAEDAEGRALTITRPNPHQWDVHGHGGAVRVRYTIFGDRTDGTYLGIDRSQALLNAPATFMWGRGLETRPVQVTFCPADSTWSVATQLQAAEDGRSFTAPHFQYFMDSPTKLGPFVLYEWPVTSGGRTQAIRVALHHQGSAEDAQRYVGAAKRIVAEQEAIFGELPEFDFGSYTFLATYLPWVYGDGMEHRNSTVLTSTGSLATAMTGLLGTVAHEFIHAWNVERIRPASLEPFDFERANMSADLWFAEGFTQYYTPLTLVRAGVITDSAYARSAGATADAVINGAGRRFHSPVEMSLQAPFVDAGVSNDPVNRVNTFISYYTYGAAIGLALDLELRARGRSLDDYMRALWREFGAQRDLAPVRPFVGDDLQYTLAAVSGDSTWADSFFARHVTGREAPDYGALLAQAGILLRQAAPQQAWIGDLQWEENGGPGLLLASPTVRGTPAYEAGLNAGDRLLSVAGRDVRSAAELGEALAERRPGDSLVVVVRSRGATIRSVLTLRASPRLEAVLYEEANRRPTAEMLRFRAAWLGARAR